MFNWLHNKLHPKTEREKLIEYITREQNYPVSEALNDLFQYLIDHRDQCEIIDNDGHWLTIGINDHIVSVWVANWPFASLDRVIIHHKKMFEQVDRLYQLHDIDNPNVLWSVEHKVPSGELVLKFHELFYPELLRHQYGQLSYCDNHEQLLAILSNITLSLNEKSKKSKHDVDKETQTMDNDKSGRSDCDNNDHSAIEGIDN